MRCAGRNIKGLTINNARYYESESANENDSKGDPAKNSKIATHTSDGKKGKVTDTRHGDLQQKLWSNRTLPIITTTMDPRIDDGVTTCRAYPHKIATPLMLDVITDTACGFYGLLGM